MPSGRHMISCCSVIFAFAIGVKPPDRGGSPCKDNSQCYSRICYLDGYCAPDGPVEGSTTGGSACSMHADCFSGYCFDGICAPDSNIKGKVVAGGPCVQHEQCFSGTCVLRRCGPDSSMIGKMAAGGECDYHSNCFSGFCHQKRCAPDGSVVGYSPGGGYCNSDAQCASGVCHASRCTVESLKERQKTGDGGRCRNDSHCEKRSRCNWSQFCTPNEIEEADDELTYHHHGRAEVERPPKKTPAGGHCKKHADCETLLCVFLSCAPTGQFDLSTVADGAQCNERIQDGQCQSGHCSDHICGVSYSGRSKISASAAGSACKMNELCYSGLCFSHGQGDSKCSSDSPVEPIAIRISHRHRYQVAAGGACEENEDCYCGFCDNRLCGADGPRRGTVASGAICEHDEQCYSKYCFNRRCAPSAGGDQEGKIAPGGPCEETDSCAVGHICLNYHCHVNSSFAVQQLIWTRPRLHSVAVNSTCWHHAQCAAGRCLAGKCTVPWTAPVKVESVASSPYFSIYFFYSIVTFLIVTTY